MVADCIALDFGTIDASSAVALIVGFCVLFELQVFLGLRL